MKPNFTVETERTSRRKAVAAVPGAATRARAGAAGRVAKPRVAAATSSTCVGFSLEGERVMQQSSDKYFP